MAAKYDKMSGFATTKGPMYETKLSALLFLRGMNSGLDFQLASNVKGAGALDDVVFKIKNQTPDTWTSYFIQLKHKDNARLSRKMLTDDQGTFALPKYYKSYEEIKLAMSAPDKATLFDGDIKDSMFVIFTNAPPHQDLGKERCASEQIDKFLGSSSGKVFSFDPDGQEEAEMAVTDSLKNNGDEGREFLKRLRIFTAQPCEAEFDVLIREELRKAVAGKSSDIDLDRLCMCFVENVKAWSENSKNLLLPGSDIFASARDRVLSENLSLIEKKANELKFEFEEAALEPLKEVLAGGYPVIHIRSSEKTCRLSSTKLLQALDGSSFLFLGSERFLDNHDAVLSEWTRRQHDMLVVSINNSDSQTDARHFEQVLAMCTSLAELRKKLVILADLDIHAASDVKRFDDVFEFSSLTMSSRDTFLETEIMLQGHRVSLKTFLNVGCDGDDGIDAVLSASTVVEIVETKPILSLGKTLADPGKYYVPRSLQILNTDINDYMRQETGRLEKKAILNVTLLEVVNIIFSRHNAQVKLDMRNKFQRWFDSFSSSAHLQSSSHEAIFVGDTMFFKNGEANFVGTTRDKAIALWTRPFNLGWTLYVFQGASEDDVSRLAKCYKWKHTIKEIDGKKKYDYSSGNHDFLRKHSELIRPEDFMDVQERALVVCGEPGMGKSTLVRYLSKKTKETRPHLWVILIALSDHFHLFAEGKHEDAAGFLIEATKTKSPLQKLMLRSALDVTGNVIVILDGYDEIAPKYSKHCCQLLTNLLETNAKKICLTTRLAVKHELESHLSTTAAELVAFNEEDQVGFLKRYWTDVRESTMTADSKRLSDEELDDFINQILKMSRSIGEPNGMLSVPLQAQMMAELFVDHVTNPSETQTLPEALNLLKLLEMFVEKKLAVYVQDKLKIKSSDTNYESLLDDNRSKFLANHVDAALVALKCSFGGELFRKKRPTKNLAEFLLKIERGEEKIGFIDGVIDGKARFAHRVYGEYFVAIWLADNKSEFAKCIELGLFFENVEGLSSVSRRLCDLILAKDCVLHTAVLNGDVGKVKRLLEAGADVNARDSGGRTPLHLTATKGLNFLTEAKHVEIMYLLIKMPKTAFNLKDNVINSTPLRYAGKNNYWLMIDKLLAHNTNLENIAWTFTNNSPDVRIKLQNTIDYFLDNDLYRVLGIFVDIFPDFCNEPSPCFSTRLTVMGDGLLANACHNGRYRTAKMLIEKGYDINGLSKENCPLRYPPLHCAALAGHLKIVKLLVNVKLKEINKERLESKNSRSDLADFVNRKASHGQTALHLASEHGHVDVVAFLIKTGADLTDLDNGKCTGVLATVVVDVGATMSRDASGRTPLMLAARNGHLEVVERIVQALKGEGDNSMESSCLIDWLDLKDKDGRTAASLAASFGYESVVTFLAGQGADTRRQGPDDQPRDYEHEERQQVLERYGSRNSKSVAINFKRLDKDKTVVRVAAINGLVQTAYIFARKSSTDSINTVGALSKRPVGGFHNIVAHFENPTGDVKLVDYEILSEGQFNLIQEMCFVASLVQTVLFRDGLCGHSSVAECLASLPSTRGFSVPQDRPRFDVSFNFNY